MTACWLGSGVENTDGRAKTISFPPRNTATWLIVQFLFHVPSCQARWARVQHLVRMRIHVASWTAPRATRLRFCNLKDWTPLKVDITQTHRLVEPSASCDVWKPWHFFLCILGILASIIKIPQHSFESPTEAENYKIQFYKEKVYIWSRVSFRGMPSVWYSVDWRWGYKVTLSK